MKAILKYLGCSPQAAKPHQYLVMLENGDFDKIEERIYTDATEVDLNWGDGWADAICDECGTVFRERTSYGEVIACPLCQTPILIPDDYELDASNMVSRFD